MQLLGAARSRRDPVMELADCPPPLKTKMCAGGALTFNEPGPKGDFTEFANFAVFLLILGKSCRDGHF